MNQALRFPKRISVELTNHCNQRCPMCPRLGFTRPLGFMDAELFERVVRECAQYDTVLWLHFLGEPLLHPHAPELIALAKQVGVRQVGLSTNAVSLAGARAEAILDAGLDRLECSVDALDRDGFVAMRGRDHFDKVTANVRAFLELKRARGLETPVTSIQFMRTAALEAVLPAVVAEWRPFLGPRDFVMTITPFPFGGAVDVPVSAPLPGEQRPPCPWLFEMLVIMQDGTVAMCNADWDAAFPLGSLRDSTITEIWTGSEIERRRAAHLAGRFGDVARCAGCEDWRLADGRGYSNVLREMAAGKR
jgi:MoaA/NifB/PqqE/SkfB family radical SAM enzyme